MEGGFPCLGAQSDMSYVLHSLQPRYAGSRAGRRVRRPMFWFEELICFVYLSNSRPHLLSVSVSPYDSKGGDG